MVERVREEFGVGEDLALWLSASRRLWGVGRISNKGRSCCQAFGYGVCFEPCLNYVLRIMDLWCTVNDA